MEKAMYTMASEHRTRTTAGATAALAMIVLMSSAVAVGQGVKEYKFTNTTGMKADDLHIKFKGGPVSWPEHEPPKQNPADTFKNANGRGTSKVGLAAGHTGRGVADGASVVITFSYSAANPPTVEEAWWTFTNDECWQGSAYYRDPNRARRIPARDLASAWSGGAARGDGRYLTMLDGQAFPFQTMRGDPPEVTARRFAEFISSLPWGLVLEVHGSRVSYTGLSYSDAWPNIAFHVQQQDNNQPVNVEELVDEPCEGDTNGDRVVDQADLATLLASFNSCCPAEDYNADADLNTDGCVNQADLATLLANFGQVCP